MDLERLLDAKSVAVIGASRDEKKRGFQAIKVLRDGGYEGEIFAVNPREDRVLGLRCYPSVADIEAPIDLALITTPAKTIPALLDECGAQGVGGAVIIAGGFGELGAEGRKLQRQIVDVARGAGLRFIGPNTSGMINVHRRLNLVGLSTIPAGDLALLSQSGNMALHLITEAELKTRKGFSYYVGVGNEADVKFHEYLEFFAADSKTRAIIMYVEGMSEGREFLRQAAETTKTKPIILLKGGHSATGQKSAGSHTGALAGISEVARTAFRHVGVTLVENSDELLPVAETLSSLPPLASKRIAILADGGGHATIAADVLTEHGVEIPKMAPATRKRLAKLLSPNASLVNPIDVAGSTDANPALFADCARTLLADGKVDGLLMVGLFGGYGIRFAPTLKFIEEDAAHQLGKLVAETGKPIIVHSLYNHARPHSLDLLRYYGIPVFDSVDVACRCVSALAEYGHYLGTKARRTNFVFKWGARAEDRGKKIIDQAIDEKRRALLEHEAKQLLGLHGAPVADERLAADEDAAVKLAKKIKGPAVLKLVSPDILHKSDAGGVELGLEGEDQVRKAFKRILRNAKRYKKGADIRGCLVAPQVGRGVEVIIGTKVDAQFGPVIMFGIGGIFVEVLKDVAFRVLPITKIAAKKLINEIRSTPILNGARGKPPVDKEALAALVLSVSELVEAYPEIAELDLNPVIVREQGLSVVDARIILKKNGGRRSG